MFEFMIRRQLAGHDLETVEGRVAALRASAPVVAGIRDRAMNVGYVRSLAGWLGMEPDEVGRAVNGARAAATALARGANPPEPSTQSASAAVRRARASRGPRWRMRRPRRARSASPTCRPTRSRAASAMP